MYCLHGCLVCATIFLAADTTRCQRPYLHACTARPHHYLHVLNPPGLEPRGCRSGPRSTFLVGCVVILSLIQAIGKC